MKRSDKIREERTNKFYSILQALEENSVLFAFGNKIRKKTFSCKCTEPMTSTGRRYCMETTAFFYNGIFEIRLLAGYEGFRYINKILITNLHTNQLVDEDVFLKDKQIVNEEPLVSGEAYLSGIWWMIALADYHGLSVDGFVTDEHYIKATLEDSIKGLKIELRYNNGVITANDIVIKDENHFIRYWNANI